MKKFKTLWSYTQDFIGYDISKSPIVKEFIQIVSGGLDLNGLVWRSWEDKQSTLDFFKDIFLLGYGNE